MRTLLSLGDERFLVDAYLTQRADIGRAARAAGTKKHVITRLMPGSVPAELAAAAGRDFAGAVAVGEDLAEV